MKLKKGEIAWFGRHRVECLVDEVELPQLTKDSLDELCWEGILKILN